jgi:hypothetical protein
MNQDGVNVLYRKVSCRVSFSFGGIVSTGAGEVKKSVVKRESTSMLKPDDSDRLDVCISILMYL